MDVCVRLNDWPDMTSNVAGLLAGAIASHLGSGDPKAPDWLDRDPAVWPGAGSDARKVRELLETGLEEESKSTFELAKNTAWEILGKELGTLHRVADFIESLSCRTDFRATGKEVVACIEIGGC
jgi:hypothetical protein